MMLTAIKTTCAPARRPLVVRTQSRNNTVTCAVAPKLDYNCSAFKRDLVEFAGEQEYIVKGGRDKFSGLAEAFAGIKEVRSAAEFLSVILGLAQRVIGTHPSRSRAHGASHNTILEIAREAGRCR